MKTTPAKIISTFIAGVMLMFASMGWADTTNFTTAGSFTWTVPNGVHSVFVECWGGAGAGGGASRSGGTGASGTGGGGGAYANSNVTVTAGSTYTVFVGGGGIHTLAATTGTAASGTNSYFRIGSVTNCLAVAGFGGQDLLGNQTAAGTLPGGGGGTNTYCIGITNWSGGNGAASGSSSRGGAGGGGAGALGAGVNAGAGNPNVAGAGGAGGGGAGGAGGVSSVAGTGGSAPGGGGGGGNAGAGTFRAGGDGAVGKVILTYTVAYDHVNVESADNGTGTTVSAQTISSGNSTNVYAIARESDNTFIANVAATWSLINKTGGVADGDLVPAGNTKSAVFTAALSGSAQIQAVFGTIITNPSGTITVPSSGTVAGWTNDADSTWTTAANWDSNPTVPSAAGDTAILGVGTALRTVTLDANETVGTLSFTNPNSFVVSGGNTLTLDKSGAGALIQVTDGSANAIFNAVSLNDNANALVGSGKTLTVSGNISSTTTSKTLTAGGPGTLILSGNNTYGPSAGTIGTKLTGGGTLQIGSNTALSTGDVTNNISGTLKSGAASLSVANNFGSGSGATLTVDNNGNALTLSGTIGGNGALTKIGNGTLTLSGANTYSGSTAINGGAVSISADGNLGTAPGSVTANNIILNGGLLLDSSSLTLNGTRGIGVGPTGGSTPGTGLIDVASGQTLTINGIIASAGNTGANNLTVNIGTGNNGTVVLNATNTFSGNTVISNGTLTLGNSFALTNSTLDYNNYGGSLSFGALTAATFGGLNGAQNLSLLNNSSAAVALTVGGNGASTTYSGALSGTGSTLTKNGSGTTVLTGNNTFSGAAQVNAGVLRLDSGGIINHAAADGVGAGNNGLMLVNGGSLTAASFNVATASQGLTVSNGSASLSGTLTMNAGGGSQASQNGLIAVDGGSLSAASLAMGRMGATITTLPTTGVTTYGFYVNGGTANISGDVSVCTQGAANSGNSMRIDSGSFTVGGLVTLAGGTSGGRWSVMDVNGGAFEVDNTASGFNIGGNNGGNATLFVRAGVAKIGKVTLGNSGQTGNTVALTMSGGSLYVGSGGIVSAANVLPANSPITMTNATLGAWADWSSTNAIFLNGTNTIKTADDSGTAHNITLSGPIGGNFNSAITKTGNGTLTLSGANFFTNGATVSAGKLNINGVNALGGAFYGGLTLAGGALEYSTNSTGNGSLDISLLPNGEVGITLASGTDTIDVNGNSVTYASPIGNGGGGSLVVQSTIPGGVLNLTTNNTYTGNTTVSGGALRVNNTTGSATGSGNVTVNSGGTLGGIGIISGAVEIASSGTLAPGNSVGTLNVGSLQLDSGSINNFEFNFQFNSPTNDLVVSSGSLTINGGGFNLYWAGSTAPWTTVGTRTLVQYTGADPSLDSTWTTPSASNPHILNPQPNALYSFAATGGKLTVTIALSGSTVSGTWTNNADGNWASAGNWDSNPSVPHSPGDIATLGTTASGHTVTLNANETVGSINFNNPSSFVIADGGNTLTMNNLGVATVFVTDGTANSIQTAMSLNNNLTIIPSSGKSVSISGNISATSSQTLTVNGAGTVALSGNNSYAGTTLGGGTLQVGNNNALGANTLNVTANGTLQASAAGLSLGNNVQVDSGVAVTVDSSGNNLTLGGQISGSGALTKIGNGKLALSGNNLFTGNTTIAGGALSISAFYNLHSSAEIVLNGGMLLGDTGIDGDGEYQNIGIGPVSGGAGGTGFLDAASAQTFLINGAIASAGNSGVNNLVVNSQPGDNGIVDLMGDNSFNGVTVISNGVLQLETSGGLQNSTLNYNNQGGYLWMNGVAVVTLGGLMGGQNLMLTNLSGVAVALTVGGNGVSTVYSGGLSDAGASSGSGSLTKAGAGTLALAGTNSYGGTTTISAGQLAVTNNGVVDTGAANVSSVGSAQLVVNGGTLVATNASSVGNPSTGLRVSAGSATYLSALSVNSAANGAMIGVTGGSLTAGSLTLGRTGLSDSSQPTAGSTTDGLYINGGAVNIITNLNMGTASAANSSVSTRIDSGSLTVGGTLTIGLNNSGRWSVVDVNGGTLTVTNSTTGINICGPFAGHSELLIRAGTATAGIIGLGNAANTQTNVDIAVLNMTGGSLYVGAGGIVQLHASTNLTPVITLYGGLLGASADWACSNDIVLGSSTIQAADSLSTAHNIALSGIMSGTNLTKTGSGTLTLSSANTYTGVTTISNGTLTLNASGSIAGTARVAISAGATFDVSALGGYTFTGVSPVQTLAGASTSGAGNVAVGGNTVTLNSGAGALFQANGSGSTVGKVSVAGNVTLNNNTVTINVTGSPLGGGTNRLLDCTGTLTGSANITPVFTGLGLASGASASVVTTTGSNGHVDLVVNGSLIPTQSAHIGGINIVGNNVVLNATNGQSGGTYYLLTSTNIAQPIGQWTPAATNVITTNGVSGAFIFTGTNVVNPNDTQQYYILSNTNNH